MDHRRWFGVDFSNWSVSYIISLTDYRKLTMLSRAVCYNVRSNIDVRFIANVIFS